MQCCPLPHCHNNVLKTDLILCPSPATPSCLPVQCPYLIRHIHLVTVTTVDHSNCISCLFPTQSLCSNNTELLNSLHLNTTEHFLASQYLLFYLLIYFWFPSLPREYYLSFPVLTHLLLLSHTPFSSGKTSLTDLVSILSQMSFLLHTYCFLTSIYYASILQCSGCS